MTSGNGGKWGTGGRLVPVGETRLHVVERGQGYPVLVLHGGPGLDHRMFGDYLDPLAARYRLILVDQRSQGRSDPAPAATWTLEQMARDVGALASALGLARYAVLGHSYGAFVALQHAVDAPGQAAQTIVSSGVPSARFLDHVWRSLERFEPLELREQVTPRGSGKRALRRRRRSPPCSTTSYRSNSATRLTSASPSTRRGRREPSTRRRCCATSPTPTTERSRSRSAWVG